MEHRKLKESAVAIATEEFVEPILPRSRVVKTSQGGQAIVEPEGFDFSQLDGMKAYREGEVLPEAEVRTNRKGVRYVKKNGEPRFYFQGNELIKIYRGLGGKKRSLFWFYNANKPLHRRMRAYWKKMGIPGA